MSSHWQSLPYEILSMIFQELHIPYNLIEFEFQDDLIECSLTCRAWTIPAQEQQFKMLFVEGYEDIYKVRRVLVQRKDGYSFGGFVREVYYVGFENKRRLDDLSFRKELTHSFELIDALFPKIETINFEIDFGYDEEALPILYGIIKDGKFASLKELPSLEIIDHGDSDENRIIVEEELYKECKEIVDKRK